MSYIKFNNVNSVTMAKNILSIDKFKGIDLTNSPVNVSANRSPYAPNMIRDVPGKVRKRMGYYKTGTYTGAINGIYTLDNIQLIHAGTNLYKDNAVIYSDMNNNKGKSWQINGKTVIVDGKKILVYQPVLDSNKQKTGAYELKKIEDIAYVPIILANKSPSGGGTTVNPLNLMSRAWKEQFLGDGTTKEYQLSLSSLDSDAVIVKELGSNGVWNTLVENTGFTVDRTNGTVTFVTAPPITPSSGVSNVEIQAYKTREQNADIINKCDVSILYGVRGNPNMIFVTGNNDYPNRDYHNSTAEITYFGDTWYSTIGQDSSKIVGYSIIANYLAAHKNEGEDGRNIIMRYATADDLDSIKNPTFPIINSIQGEGAVGKNCFAYLNEPLFATKRGIYAVATADITGERYSQNRSFYINKTLADIDLTNAYAVAYKDFYIIATSSGVYILDTLQKEYTKNTPYSTYQYECYYWDIKNISAMWVDSEENLCFGTNEGFTYKFYNDAESLSSYSDDGNAIVARWDIPDITGKNFFKNKTFRYVAVKLGAAINTGFSLYSLSRGLWTKLFDTGARANYFDFSYVDFSKINFSSDTTPRTVGSKIKVKKVDRARFSLRNENNNEPMSIYEIAFEYTESGNYKG